MKKVATILLILSFLSAAVSCDFIRKVAGRPTSADLERMEELIQEHRRDSIIKAEIAQRQRMEEAARKADSLAMAEICTDFEIKFSNRFSFGEPSSREMGKYNVVIGVYRYLSTFAGQVQRIASYGFEPFEIAFPEEGYAVCLGAADSLEELRDLILRGRSYGVCPKDAWIYVNNK